MIQESAVNVFSEFKDCGPKLFQNSFSPRHKYVQTRIKKL